MSFFPFIRFKIEGESMAPSLRAGDEVLVCSWLKGRVGDTIVFKKEARIMIKKIERINSDPAHAGERDREVIYVKGENGEKSTDSREFGSITKEQIIGKVLKLSWARPLSFLRHPPLAEKQESK